MSERITEAGLQRVEENPAAAQAYVPYLVRELRRLRGLIVKDAERVDSIDPHEPAGAPMWTGELYAEAEAIRAELARAAERA